LCTFCESCLKCDAFSWTKDNHLSQINIYIFK
jgi:hypothetical protein